MRCSSISFLSLLLSFVFSTLPATRAWPSAGLFEGNHAGLDYSQVVERAAQMDIRMEKWQANLEDDLVSRDFERKPGFGLTYVGEDDIKLMQIDGSTEVTLDFWFRPERQKDLDDYVLEELSTELDVLFTGTNGDTEVSELLLDTSTGVDVYNFSVTFVFDRTVGETTYTMTYTQSVEQPDGSTAVSVFDSQEIRFTISGISIFATDENGVRELVSGQENAVRIESYESLSDGSESGELTFEARVQFPNGTTVDTALEPSSTADFSKVQIEALGNDGQIVYRDACVANGGRLENGTVVLDPQCGYGFPVDGQPFFGTSLEPHRAGDFQLVYTWPVLTEALEETDLDFGTEFQQVLNFKVEGTAPPMIIHATPSGPFYRDGGDRITVSTINAPDFTNAYMTVDGVINPYFYLPGSFIDWGPDGSPQWQMQQVSKGTVELDFRVGSFTAGPREGGTEVVLSATFPEGFDPTTDRVFFDGEEIPPSEIDSVVTSDRGITTIIFQSPPYVDGSYKKEITIRSDGLFTDPAFFFYTGGSDIQVYSVSPDSGLPDEETFVEIQAYFPDGFDTSMDTIQIGDSVVQNSQISSVSTDTYGITTIRMRLPAMNDGPQSQPLVFTSAGQDSSAVYYTYLEPGVEFADVIVPGSPFTQEFTLLTSPGSGQNLDWDLTVQTLSGSGQNRPAPDLTQPPFLVNYFNANIELTTVEPNNGPVEGLENVTLTGSFVDFEADRDGIFVGNKKVPVENIKSVTVVDGVASIVFDMPPYQAGSYTKDVQVSVGGDFTQRLEFTYTIRDISASISVVGASEDEDGGFTVGACSASQYSVDVEPPGALSQGIMYTWSVFDTAGNFVAAGSSPTIDVDPDTLALQTIYTVLVVVETEFGAISTASIRIARVASAAIGVKILDTPARSIISPDAPTLLSSVITLPDACYTGGLAIIYTWTYRGKEFSWSSQNVSDTVDQITTPTRLGRELNIAQQDMAYGTFVVTLQAAFEEDQNVFGSDRTTFSVEPAPLLAVINSGDTEIVISSASSFEMAASGSYDPDILDAVDKYRNLTYTWYCQFSDGDRTFSSSRATLCDQSLLPDSTASSFLISSAALENFRSPTNSVFIRYRLLVSKESNIWADNGLSSPFQRTSEFAFQVVELVQTTEILTSVSGFSVTSPNPTDTLSGRKNVDITAVKFYEDILITPITEDPDIAWQISVETVSESTFLFDGDNLIPGTQYYQGNSRDAQQKPLGILADRLNDNTEYLFKFVFSKAGQGGGTRYLTLSTIERPAIIFEPLDLPDLVTHETVIRAVASNSIGSSDVLYYFFLENADRGSSDCIGGCAGSSTVFFQVATEGQYSLKCVMVDGQGITTLDEEENIVTISVETELTSNITAVQSLMEVQYLTGDHAAFEQLTRDLATALGLGTQLRQANGEAADSAAISEVIINIVDIFTKIVTNSVPNTLLGTNYLQSALALLSLGPDDLVTFEENELVSLLTVPRHILQRTPDSEALAIIDVLPQIYNVSIYHASQFTAQGTTRRRLLQQDPGEVNQVILDVYEQMKPQFLVGLLKNKACGFIGEISTAANAIRSSIQGLSAMVPTFFKAAVFCNDEQGVELSLEEAVGTFEWCPEAFGTIGANRADNSYFLLMGSPDYVSISGVQGSNKTETASMLTSMGGRIEPNNVFNETLPVVDYCYVLGTTISEQLEVANDTILDAYSVSDSKVWQDDAIQYESYSRDFERIVTGFTPGESTVRMYSNRVGTFGADVAVAPPTPEAIPSSLGPQSSLTGSAIAGVVTGMMLFIILAVLVAWLVATRCFIIGAAPAPVISDYTYVERDVYGRGAVFDDADMAPGDVDGDDAGSGEDRDSSQALDLQDIEGGNDIEDEADPPDASGSMEDRPTSDNGGSGSV